MSPALRWWCLLVPAGLVLGCGAEQQRTAAGALATRTAVSFSQWSEPENLGPAVNSTFPDLSPALSRDGQALYFASDRPAGDRDLWVSRRACRGCPWGAPVNLGPGINSTFQETDVELSPDGRLLFFVSNRPGGLGGDDIYVSRREDPMDELGWGPPENLGPIVNTALGETGPCFLGRSDDPRGNFYFNRGDDSRTVAGFDIYQAWVTRRGEPLGVAVLVSELSRALGSGEPGFADGRAAVRGDGREVFFWSDRPGSGDLVAGRRFDLWTSTRSSAREPWSEPVNAGAPPNSEFNELTLDLSHDGRTLVFASNRTGTLGNLDLWIATRSRVEGGEDGDGDDGGDHDGEGEGGD